MVKSLDQERTNHKAPISLKTTLAYNKYIKHSQETQRRELKIIMMYSRVFFFMNFEVFRDVVK